MSGHRDSADERSRVDSLERLLPDGNAILEIGSRDGFITARLANRYRDVVALDLHRPDVDLANVTCVQGDVRALPWGSDTFDVVLCSEVLEHIPPGDLSRACHELARVTRHHLLVGVPFEQDLRVARTRCSRCGVTNPPYGHVNRFDERRLESLFDSMRAASRDRVGSTRESTTWLSDALMGLGGYPWGTYEQDEPCVACGQPVGPAPERSFMAFVLSNAAFRIDRLVRRVRAPRAKWIHVLFTKTSSPARPRPTADSAWS